MTHSSPVYLSLTIDLPEAHSERAQDLLHEAGALGLEVRDREAPPMPGVRGPNPGQAIVIGFFDDRAQIDEARSSVDDAALEATMTIEEVPQVDWSSQWKSLIKSTQVGRLWVGPPWEADNAPADKIRLVIEPKMAFGT